MSSYINACFQNWKRRFKEFKGWAIDMFSRQVY